MRKIHSSSLLLMVLMVSFLSCKKESVNALSPAAPGETMAVKIAPNQSYILNLPDLSNLSINRQAAHFLVSEAVLNAESGSFSYRYIPAADFTGADEITLMSSKTIAGNASGSNDCDAGSGDTKASSSINLITLKITVEN